MIRLIRCDDVDALVAMAASTRRFKPHEIDVLRDEVFPDYFAELEEGESWTLEIDGELQGFTYFGPEPMTVGTWIVWWIVVRPDLQGRGLGKKLLRHAENTVRKAGGRILFIDTSTLPEYESTWNFYLRNGYEREAVLRDF